VLYLKKPSFEGLIVLHISLRRKCRRNTTKKEHIVHDDVEEVMIISYRDVVHAKFLISISPKCAECEAYEKIFLPMRISAKPYESCKYRYDDIGVFPDI
jgi:hypothetical protein